MRRYLLVARRFTTYLPRLYSTRNSKSIIPRDYGCGVEIDIGQEAAHKIGLNSPIVKINPIILRDACQCKECVNPSTLQKTFSTPELNYEQHIIVKRDEPSSNNYIDIEWYNGNKDIPKHNSRYPIHLIERLASYREARRYRHKDNIDVQLWEPHNILHDWKCRKIDFNEYFRTRTGLIDGLEGLARDGLIKITNIPTGEKIPGQNSIIVEEIAKRLCGYVKNTFYGESWDVVNVNNAKNIAYTNVYLPLHMDLLYYESPPGVQYLHCIENDAKGGESIFADSYAAAQYIRETNPQGFKLLTQIPITFHYENDNLNYHQSRPLIELDEYSAIKGQVSDFREIKYVNYSPPFQGPFEIQTNLLLDNKNFENFLFAYRQFEDYINNPNNQYQTRMQPGSCYIFLNRRILHSRRQFSDSPGNNRHLKGAYSDIDAFNSAVRVHLS